MATPETTLRLKSVLDILAEAHAAGSPSTGPEIVAEALLRVPPTAHEQELLSGGIPRGFKNLTTATSRLVKAGWMTKARGGWAITEEGLRAASAFTDPQALLLALDGSIPVPPVVPEQAAPEQAVPAETPQLTVVREQAVPVRTVADHPAEHPAGQPAAVALVGDFNVLLGAARNWDPAADQAQMSFDAATGAWKLEADLPAGTYAFKFALERSWTENYGAFGLRDGANHELRHDGGPLVFTYDHTTRDLAAAPGLAQQGELLASA